MFTATVETQLELLALRRDRDVGNPCERLLLSLLSLANCDDQAPLGVAEGGSDDWSQSQLSDTELALILQVADRAKLLIEILEPEVFDGRARDRQSARSTRRRSRRWAMSGNISMTRHVSAHVAE